MKLICKQIPAKRATTQEVTDAYNRSSAPKLYFTNASCSFTLIFLASEGVEGVRYLLAEDRVTSID